MIYIFPTDTVYGIACKLDDITSMHKIREIKKRDMDKPFAILCANLEQVKELVLDFDYSLKYLEHWPGALTIVFMKSDKVSDEVTSGLDTVGIRIPNHPELLRFLEINGPMVTSSLNISGELPITTKQEAQEFYKDAIYLDWTLPNLNIASTVVTTNGRILRQGSINL